MHRTLRPTENITAMAGFMLQRNSAAGALRAAVRRSAPCWTGEVCHSGGVDAKCSSMYRPSSVGAAPVDVTVSSNRIEGT